MAEIHRCPQLFEVSRCDAFTKIGAAHLKTQIQQHLGDAAHAGTADANEVQVFDFVFHAANPSQILATASAASALANPRAFCAIANNFSRPRSPSIRSRSICASFSGLNSLCGNNTAAPRLLKNCALQVW